jgi:hypothetical protein
MKQIRTKPALQTVIVFRAFPRDLDLARAAAAQREISVSDFCRQALREKVNRLLLDSAGQDAAKAEGAE